jgi:hypothetical protein
VSLAPFSYFGKLVGLIHLLLVTNIATLSFPKIMHTPEGKRATEKLWEETMTELEFANARGVLSSMNNKSL